jgi:uncharacterized protein with PIN domain
MRFLADENFRWDVIRFLKDQGHDVKSAPRNTEDKKVVDTAHKEKRILLTNDNDFSITLQFPPKKFSGILIFHIHPPRFEKYILAIRNFLDTRRNNQINGKTFLIEEYSFIEIV